MATYIERPFAESGDKTTIPTDTQPDGSVSYQDGWPLAYQQDPATNPNARRLSRANFNGLFNVLSDNVKEWQEQTFPDWIADAGSGTPFSYGQYRIVTYTDGNAYISLEADNTDEPTQGGSATSWQLFGEFISQGTELPSVTGTATYTNATNTVRLTGWGAVPDGRQGAEIGDVIQISGSTNAGNNELFTIEVQTLAWASGVSITTGDLRKQLSDRITYRATSTGTTSGTDVSNDTGVTWEISPYDEFIVNQAHAGKSRTTAPRGRKSLIDETGTPNVTVSILSKWFTAPNGTGQGWTNMSGSRAPEITYTNTTGKPIVVSTTYVSSNDSAYAIEVDGVKAWNNGTRDSSDFVGATAIVPNGSTYKVTAVYGTPFETNEVWSELR